MRVLMIAPPGAGKGTQGGLIAAHFDIPHIATGELPRASVRLDQLDLAVASSRLEARLLYGRQCRARSVTSAGCGR